MDDVRLLSLLAGVLPLMAASPSALAQSHSGCYVEDDGRLYDLAVLCDVPNFRGAEPVLQTGDVQVTLRWQTEDDLDLIVTDPGGDTVSYFNPAVPSGGQLDVDANAYCENPGFSPVENIFWPTESAPTGDYSALVVLSIPCAEQSGPVNYTLTILNQGESQTYEGSVGPGGLDTPYDFVLE
ncbi:MAG: hypothetical protein AAFZ80_10735 [Cyanobacteria bacterium P01_A01_bin.105]